MSASVGTDSQVGRTIDGRYQLEEQLGTGTLGVTFRARHVEHQRVVALKLFHDDVGDDALRRGRFEWEAATLAALGHPNIASIVDYGVFDGQRWTASEWLEGESLAARTSQGALPLTAAVPLVRQLLAALASAHAARLLHRNVKPSNVFLERRTGHGRERLKLLDFAPASRPARAGTPAPVPPLVLSPFSPPELAAGEPLDARSDVYAVGATLIYMLSGDLPDLPAADSGARTSAPDRVRALPGVDASLMGWIRRATSVQRPMRFADAADMLRELIDLLPRDLRSPSDGSDGASRAVSMPAVNAAPQASARPTVIPPPLPSMRRKGPPPLPRRDSAAPRSALHPGLPPSDAGVATPAAAGSTELGPSLWSGVPSETHALDPRPLDSAELEAPAARHESARGTLRPIESEIVVGRTDPRLRQLMAAGLFGAFVIAVVVMFFQPGGQGGDEQGSRAVEPRARPEAPSPDPMDRATTGLSAPHSAPSPQPSRTAPAGVHHAAVSPAGAEPARAAAAAAPAVGTAAPAEEAAAPTEEAAAPAAARERAEAPSIVAAPGRPPVRDPWQEALPAPLQRVRELALNGAAGDENKVKMLREFNRDHPNDARGYLLIAQFYCNRLWRTDCVEELTTALQRDPTARGAPEILPALLDMVAQGKAQPLAEKLVLSAYGTEALDEIELAFGGVKNPSHAARLHALRLKITGDRPEQ